MHIKLYVCNLEVCTYGSLFVHTARDMHAPHVQRTCLKPNALGHMLALATPLVLKNALVIFILSTNTCLLATLTLLNNFH